MGKLEKLVLSVVAGAGILLSGGCENRMQERQEATYVSQERSYSVQLSVARSGLQIRARNKEDMMAALPSIMANSNRGKWTHLELIVPNPSPLQEWGGTADMFVKSYEDEGTGMITISIRNKLQASLDLDRDLLATLDIYKMNGYSISSENMADTFGGEKARSIKLQNRKNYLTLFQVEHNYQRYVISFENSDGNSFDPNGDFERVKRGFRFTD